MVLVRESTEGLFYARGRGDVRGDEEVFDTVDPHTIDLVRLTGAVLTVPMSIARTHSRRQDDDAAQQTKEGTGHGDNLWSDRGNYISLGLGVRCKTSQTPP